MSLAVTSGEQSHPKLLLSLPRGEEGAATGGGVDLVWKCPTMGQGGSLEPGSELGISLSGSPKENGEGKAEAGQVCGVTEQLSQAQAGVGRAVLQHAAALGGFEGLGRQS